MGADGGTAGLYLPNASSRATLAPVGWFNIGPTPISKPTVLCAVPKSAWTGGNGSAANAGRTWSGGVLALRSLGKNTMAAKEKADEAARLYTSQDSCT